MTVPGAQAVEEDTQQEEVQSLEEARGLAACVEVVEGSCYSLVADRPGASWVVGIAKEVEGLEVELWVVGRRGDGMAVLVVRSWVASGRRRDLQSSSSTAGSGSPHRTCRSWWWT